MLIVLARVLRASRYFNFEDEPSRRLRPEMLSRAQAFKGAKAFARDKGNKLK